MTTALIKYDAACRAIAECKAIDEVKDWRDKAELERKRYDAERQKAEGAPAAKQAASAAN